MEFFILSLIDASVESIFVTKESSDLDKTHKTAIKSSTPGNEEMRTSQLTAIVTTLVDITRKTNKALGGMIMMTYINCLFLATISLYLTSSMIINRYQGMELLILAIARVLMAGLSISRLFFITTMGQGLASGIKNCVYSLKKHQIDIDCPDKVKQDKLDSIYQLLKDNSHSPITPISAFSLSNRTLLGLSATILTYLVVLIRFKTCKNDRLDFLEEIARQNLTFEHKN